MESSEGVIDAVVNGRMTPVLQEGTWHADEETMTGLVWSTAGKGNTLAPSRVSRSMTRSQRMPRKVENQRLIVRRRFVGQVGRRDKRNL